ncbi:hypothetical protein BSZ35_10785 [Salinibacter sp. 10B]|uniref:hypothetical protein n=1 Tax=Salinibacter sp. 10B TaxID=1923971 RepID=UPI000CF3968C|nr:hypothetical protein [Salinibacter sp. 10B]PQJ35017.1 hypothetical protein BSZ35_10785 [Salinibacter sp. 10B]
MKWSIEHRRKSYYSKNAIDMAVLINDLRTAGNEEAELITTHEQRAKPDESPHSWRIVDEPELMTWIVSHINGE